MNIIFVPNSDGNTCTMTVDNEEINDIVPFNPSKCIDHRGFNLYLYIKQNGFKIEDFKFEVFESFEILRGYKYMLNPVYLKDAIINLMIGERVERSSRVAET